ncbi:TVP38/TMEM64 family protein [Natronomonas halophila]|uniref:TVP38/TMEM64 family protein n=1 Tax=Natronomonas halophila TaxID=2747817 RepID=UPI001FEB9764|nr:VTT domain-containing protein [Natronomonas halophila]
MNRATARQLVGIGVVVAIAGAAALSTSPSALFAHAEALAARPVLLALALGGLYLVRPALAWPISALSILLGYLFGPIAIPIALGGAVLTALPAYTLARYLGHDAGMLARVGDAGSLVRKTTGDLRGIVAVRLAPLPTDPVSYAAGLAGVPLRPYVLGTVIGESPWVVTAVLLGASMGELTTAGASADPLLLGTALALAVLLALSGPAYRRIVGNAGA